MLCWDVFISKQSVEGRLLFLQPSKSFGGIMCRHMGMEVTMEYLTGKTEKKTLGIQDILAGEYEGKEVTVNGAVHKIRDMGDVAFVVFEKERGAFADRL